MGSRHTKIKTTMSNKAQGLLEAEVQQWVREAAEAGDYAKADNLLGWRHHGTVANSEHVSATVQKGKTEKKAKAKREPENPDARLAINDNEGGVTDWEAVVFLAVRMISDSGLLTGKEDSFDITEVMKIDNMTQKRVCMIMHSLRGKGLLSFDSYTEKGIQRMSNLQLGEKA